MSESTSHEVGDNGQTLVVNLTDEGIILDAYDNDGALIGTRGMTFDEWYEYVVRSDPLGGAV